MPENGRSDKSNCDGDDTGMPLSPVIEYANAGRYAESSGVLELDGVPKDMENGFGAAGDSAERSRGSKPPSWPNAVADERGVLQA